MNLNEAIKERISNPFKEYGLSKMQAKVAALYARGYEIPEIAVKLEVEETTVKTHMARAANKIGVAPANKAWTKRLIGDIEALCADTSLT